MPFEVARPIQRMKTGVCNVQSVTDVVEPSGGFEQSLIVDINGEACVPGLSRD